LLDMWAHVPDTQIRALIVSDDRRAAAGVWLPGELRGGMIVSETTGKVRGMDTNKIRAEHEAAQRARRRVLELRGKGHG
jgi:hypothetical protein